MQAVHAIELGEADGLKIADPDIARMLGEIGDLHTQATMTTILAGSALIDHYKGLVEVRAVAAGYRLAGESDGGEAIDARWSSVSYSAVPEGSAFTTARQLLTQHGTTVTVTATVTIAYNGTAAADATYATK